MLNVTTITEFTDTPTSIIIIMIERCSLDYSMQARTTRNHSRILLLAIYITV